MIPITTDRAEGPQEFMQLLFCGCKIACDLDVVVEKEVCNATKHTNIVV